MIHHTSNSGYKPNCRSSSTVQAIRLIKRDQDNISSENQREKILVQYLQGQAETFHHTITKSEFTVEICMKEQPGKGS